MGFWSGLGTIAGGALGGLAGGPAGAALGAAGGGALGAGVDDLGSASDTPQSGYTYDVTKADPNAPVAADQNNVLGASQGYVSPGTAQLAGSQVNQTNATNAASVQQNEAIFALKKALMAEGFDDAHATAMAQNYASNPDALNYYIQNGDTKGGGGGIHDPALATAAANLQAAQSSVAAAAKSQAAFNDKLGASRAVDSSDLSAYARGASGALDRKAAAMGGITIDQSGLGAALGDAQKSYNAIGATAGEQGALAGRLANDQTGAGQQNLVDRLNGDLSGKAPSLAELQLKEGEDAAVRSQLAMAASATPQNYAAASRQAQMNAANIDQSTNMQTAQTRAAEYATNEALLGSTLQQQRAGTLASAKTAGDIYGQQQQAQNAAGGLAIAGGHEALGAATAQAGMNYQVAGANMNSGIQQQQLNQSLYGQNLAAYQARQEAIRQQQNQNVSNQLGGAQINAGIAGQNLSAQTAANNTKVAVAGQEIALGSAAVKAAGDTGVTNMINGTPAPKKIDARSPEQKASDAGVGYNPDTGQAA